MVTWMSDESFLPPKTSRWTEATFRAVGTFFLTIEVVWKWPTVLHFPLLWVLFPWLCVSTHLNPPEQQTAEIFAFIESLTFADDKLQVHWLAHLAATFVRLHFGLVSVKDIMTQSNGTCCLSVCLPRFKICKRLVMVPVSARSAQRGCKCFCFALSLSLASSCLGGAHRGLPPLVHAHQTNHSPVALNFLSRLHKFLRAFLVVIISSLCF